MAKSPLSVRRPSTLSAYKPSLREQAAILGEKGFKALTGREPGYEARENINRYTGLLDMLNLPGIALSADDLKRSLATKQYGAAVGDIASLAAGAIPMFGGALKGGAKKVVEEGVKGAGKLVEKYDLSKILKSVPEPAEYIEKGSERFVFSDPTSGGRMAVVTRPTGPRSASVIDLHVPEEYRGTNVGRTLQAAVLRDFPSLGGQVSSKAAAKNAYAAGRRMAGNEGASLEDIFKAIDENSSVNLWTPENLTTKYDLPPVITGAEREANLARFMEGSQAPRDLYHGTGADISEFKKSNTGEFGPGLYMTTSPSEAEMYANISNTSANIMPVYANIKNPFFVEKSPSEFWNTFGGGTDEEATQRAIAAGYDGVVFKRPVEVWSDKLKKTIPTGEMQSHVIAFHPETQIKSKYNIGTFDPTTPHIGKAHGGPVSLSDKYGC